MKKVDTDVVVNAYKRGKSMNAIAKAFNTYPSYISRILKKNNVELRHDAKRAGTLYVSDGEKHGSINKIIALAKQKKIIVNEISKAKLNQMAQTENNQGVIAIVPPFNYCDVDDILQTAKDRNEKPFILILDGIEDPHNLGSIIRTAETAGVHGIIIPKRRACRS